MSRHLCLMALLHQKTYKYQCEKQPISLSAPRALTGLAGHDHLPLPTTTTLLPMASGAPLQLRPGSGRYETRKSHEVQLSKAMACPHKAPHGSSKLHVSSFLTTARLQVRLCLAVHLNDPLGSWLTPLTVTAVLCSPGLGTGHLHPARSRCTAAFPELQPGPWFYSSGIQLQEVRLPSSS